jgi:hypothetical protein
VVGQGRAGWVRQAGPSRARLEERGSGGGIEVMRLTRPAKQGHQAGPGFQVVSKQYNYIAGCRTLYLGWEIQGS